MEAWLEEMAAIYDKKTLISLYTVATDKAFGFLYIKVNAKAKEDMFYDSLQRRLIPRIQADDEIKKYLQQLVYIMVSNIDDPIHYNSKFAHTLLSANRLTSQLIARPITWRSYRTNNDPDNVFTVNLDTENTGTEAQRFITLNRAGLYHITASIARDNTSVRGPQVTTCGLILIVRYPTVPTPSSLEYAYRESGMNDFTTFLTSNILKVPANLVGVQIAIEIKSQLGSADAIIRGYKNNTNTFDAGSDGSFLEITYLGV